mgnify:CR=1 FL=1
MFGKLTAVGIDSPEKLVEAGAKQAFFKLKETFPNVCLVHLYALEGAITDQEYNELPEFYTPILWNKFILSQQTALFICDIQQIYFCFSPSIIIYRKTLQMN